MIDAAATLVMGAVPGAAWRDTIARAWRLPRRGQQTGVPWRSFLLRQKGSLGEGRRAHG